VGHSYVIEESVLNITGNNSEEKGRARERKKPLEKPSAPCEKGTKDKDKQKCIPPPFPKR